MNHTGQRQFTGFLQQMDKGIPGFSDMDIDGKPHLFCQHQMGLEHPDLFLPVPGLIGKIQPCLANAGQVALKKFYQYLFPFA